jgi:hypothetical protein
MKRGALDWALLLFGDHMRTIRELEIAVAMDPKFMPWLSVVQNPGIQADVQRVDDDYVAMFNQKTKRYEIHCTHSRGPETFCVMCDYDQLDGRTVQKLWETSFKHQGDVFAKMHAHNAAVKAARQKDFDRDIESKAWETGKDLAYAQDKDDLYDGYSKVHVV